MNCLLFKMLCQYTVTVVLVGTISKLDPSSGTCTTQYFGQLLSASCHHQPTKPTETNGYLPVIILGLIYVVYFLLKIWFWCHLPKIKYKKKLWKINQQSKGRQSEQNSTTSLKIKNILKIPLQLFFIEFLGNNGIFLYQPLISRNDKLVLHHQAR